MLKNVLLPLSFFLLIIGMAASSNAQLVNLSDWDAWGPVYISPDGLTATLFEEEAGGTSLENLAFAIPNNATSFSFEYSFTVAAGNDDYFDFYFYDPSEPVFSLGGLNGSETDLVFSGSYSFAINDLQGIETRMIFALQWGWKDAGYDSTLVISNVDITTEQMNPVPEPGTVFLIAIGMVGLLATRTHSSKVRPHL